MKVPFTVYDAAGRILRSGHAPSEAAARGQGDHVLVGVIGDDARQQVFGGELVDRIMDEPTLIEVRAEARDRIEREAALRRRGLMPLDRVLAAMIDVLDDPTGPSRPVLDEWRANIAAIETVRRDAIAAIEAATTIAEARAAGKPDWDAAPSS